MEYDITCGACGSSSTQQAIRKRVCLTCGAKTDLRTGEVERRAEPGITSSKHIMLGNPNEPIDPVDVAHPPDVRIPVDKQEVRLPEGYPLPEATRTTHLTSAPGEASEKVLPAPKGERAAVERPDPADTPVPLETETDETDETDEEDDVPKAPARKSTQGAQASAAKGDNRSATGARQSAAGKATAAAKKAAAKKA